MYIGVFITIKVLYIKSRDCLYLRVSFKTNPKTTQIFAQTFNSNISMVILTLYLSIEYVQTFNVDSTVTDTVSLAVGPTCRCRHVTVATVLRPFTAVTGDCCRLQVVQRLPTTQNRIRRSSPEFNNGLVIWFPNYLFSVNWVLKNRQ